MAKRAATKQAAQQATNIAGIWVVQDAADVPVPKGALADAALAAAVIAEECEAIRDLLLRKNAAYGNAALSPLRIFSKLDSAAQLRVRIDDKLSRIRNGHDDDETVRDLAGYLVLLLVRRGLDGVAKTTEASHG